MGALIAVIAALLALMGGGKKSDVPAQGELGTRVAKFRSLDTAVSPSADFEVYLTAISGKQMGWYAYKDGKPIGSGSAADDDAVIRAAWEFLVSQISSGASVELSIDGPKGKASAKVDPIVEAGSVSGWRYNATVGNKASSAPADSRGAALMAAVDWIEANLIGKEGGGIIQPQPDGKYSGNGVTIDEGCKAITISSFPEFIAYARPRIAEALSAAKAPSAMLLAEKTIGPAAGLNGCPRPGTKINGRPWAELEPDVRDAIAAMVKSDWLSVSDPPIVLAHYLIGTRPGYPGTVERYNGHALVVRPTAGGAYEALIFPGPARTLDGDAERIVRATQSEARARAHAMLSDGPDAGGGIADVPPKPDQHVPQPKLPSPQLPQGGKPGTDWGCAVTGYNPPAKSYDIPQVGWAARKTTEIEIFKISGKWANCSKYDVRVGLCLRAPGAGPYGELSAMLNDPPSADMSKVPVMETSGGTLPQSDMWRTPPAWKQGLRFKIRNDGDGWKLDGGIDHDSGTGGTINACPGTASHWPEPHGEHFNVHAEDGSWQRWLPKPEVTLGIKNGDRVVLVISYSGIPLFKRYGNHYRAKYSQIPLVFSARVDARGEP